MEDSWETIKKLYEEKFNIPPRIVDLVAVEDILSQCVEGLSNKIIAFSYNDDITYVEKVLKEFIGFEGWKEDLDINPLKIFTTHPEYLEYCSHIATISPLVTQGAINRSYNLCRKYKDIRKEIEKYYDS